MAGKTSKDYFIAVKSWYGTHHQSLHSGLLADPSNGALKELCLALYREGLSAADLAVFRAFFGVPGQEDLGNAIRRFDIEKFRPVVNFLKGVSQKSDIKKVNLVAVLIGFPQRPLPRFLQDAPLEPEPPTGEVSVSSAQTGLSVTKGPFRPQRARWRGIIGIFLAIGLATMFLMHLNADKQGCMTWDGHSYVRVDCCDATCDPRLIEPFNETQSKVCRITVGPHTAFFINNMPQVWYLKHDGHYDFFNNPGYHPVYRGKTLHEVTPYIAMGVKSGKIRPEP